MNDSAARMREHLLQGEAVHTREGVAALGTFIIELPTPATVRAIALAGFDFVIIDLEHSSMSLDTVEQLISEARGCGLTCLVRVPNDQPSLIGRVLDVGANGVMVPHVSTAAEAAAVVAQARFSPEGQRGFSPLTMFSALNCPQQQLNDACLVIVQIEGKEGLSNAGPIAATAGVDAVFVGPYDLAESLGTPSDITSPEVLSAVASIAADVPRQVLLGIYMDDPGKSQFWRDEGFLLQCIGYDGQMLYERAREVLRLVSSAVPAL